MSIIIELETGLPAGEKSNAENEALLSEELIEIYAGRQQEWAQQALKDNEFRHGVQWPADAIIELRKRRQAANVWNLIHPTIEMEKALLTDNTPRFQATAKENSDRELAAVVSDIMAHIWHISGGDVAMKQVVDDYAVMGRGCFMVYVDPASDFGRGDIKIKSLYPLHVYPDPDSADPFCRDSAHILISCIYSGEQVQAEYPGAWDKIKKEGTPSSRLRNPVSYNDDLVENRQTAPMMEQRTDVDYYEVLDRYTKVLIKRRHVLNVESGREDVFDEAEFAMFLQRDAFQVTGEAGTEIIYTIEGVEEITRLIMENAGESVYHQQMVFGQDEMGNEVPMEPQLVAGEPGADAVPGTRIQFSPVKYADVLMELPFDIKELELLRIKRVLCVGGIEIYNQILEIDQYPVVVLNNNHNRNPYPFSDVRYMRDPQEYYNKMKSLILAHTANSAGTKVIVPRGSDVGKMAEEWGKAGVAFIEADLELGQPIVAQVPPLSNQVFVELRDAEHKIQKVAGIYDMQAGDASAAPNTYKGTLAVEEYGQRRMRSKRESIEGFLNAVAHVVAQMIPKVYTYEKVIRLFQPNQAPKETKLNEPLYDEITGEVISRVNDIGAMNYDIVVVSGSTLPSNRWARFEAMLQLFQMGLIDDITMLKYTDVPDIESVIARKSRMAALMSENEALKEELKRISGDLQTAQRESVSDRKRVEVEQFSARLAKLEAAAGADVKVLTERAKDALRADDKIMNIIAGTMQKQIAPEKKEEA